MRRWWYSLALLGALALPAGLVIAANPNEREVKPRANVLDPDRVLTATGELNLDSKIWVLEFRFKDPRLITVDIPGRGRKLCWYLWYQVINRYKEPHTFIPDFELVTLDKQTSHRDEVLPTVQDAIKAIEDPTGYLGIKNSVTIAAEPISAMKENSIPRPATGVAVWPIGDKEGEVSPDCNRFSIFVSGLSNGWNVDDNHVVRRKTLKLDFRRLGDRFFMDAREVRFDGPAEWIYRGSKLKLPAGAAPAAPKKDEEAPKAGAALAPAPRPVLPEGVRLPQYLVPSVPERGAE